MPGLGGLYLSFITSAHLGKPSPDLLFIEIINFLNEKNRRAQTKNY